MKTEFVKFRMFNMPCCHIFICWVNPRLPNYCPECGARAYRELKNPEHTVFCDENAQLKHQ